jgi:hypothetical protein
MRLPLASLSGTVNGGPSTAKDGGQASIGIRRMKAVCVHAFDGAPGSLRIDEVPVPRAQRSPSMPWRAG